MGLVIGAQLATLYELQTVYGSEDLQNLVEVAYVDGLNRKQPKKE